MLCSAPRGNRLNLTFSHFELEQHHPRHTNCSYDYLAIAQLDASNNTAAGGVVRYCGDNMPPAVSTAGSAVRLEFVSDNSVAQNGFRVEWVVDGCGGRLTKPAATFRQEKRDTYTVYICIMDKESAFWLHAVSRRRTVQNFGPLRYFPIF
jgi:hypothetical protein